MDHARATVLAVVAVTLGACAAHRESKAPLGAVPTAPALPPPSADARVDAALASGDWPFWPLVETTTTVVGTRREDPRPTPPRLPGAPIQIPVLGECFDERFLGELTIDDFDLGDVASRATSCVLRDGSAVKVSFIPASPPIVDADAGASDACLGAVLAKHDYRGCITFDANLVARLRSVRSAGTAPAVIGDEYRATSEEISVLDQRLASASSSEDARRIRFLLATRIVDRALVTSNDAHRQEDLSRAIALLRSIVGDAALERLAYVLNASGQLDESFAAHLRLVCPDLTTDWPQNHSASYWQHWSDAHPEIATRWMPKPDKPSRHFAAAADGPRTRDEETAYRSPFAGCRVGFADSWYAIGLRELRGDDTAGPYRWRRAVDAFRRALAAAGTADERSGVP